MPFVLDPMRVNSVTRQYDCDKFAVFKSMADFTWYRLPYSNFPFIKPNFMPSMLQVNSKPMGKLVVLRRV